jgi:iron-sulfur cluster repair protein YtfE (RIC family)
VEAKSADVTAYEIVLREHRRLKDLLTRVDLALTQRTSSISEVASLLAQLGDQLIKHFALEEDGNYFADLMLRAPQLISRANALMAQHPKMCTRVRELAVDLAAPQGPNDWWQETRRRFDAFRAELLRHETCENGLLQDAYVQDLGAHD